MLGYGSPGTGTLSVLISTLGDSETTTSADGSTVQSGWSSVRAFSLDVGSGELTLEALAAVGHPCPGAGTTDASGKFYLLPDACSSKVTVAHLGLSGEGPSDPEFAPGIEEITGSPYMTDEGALEARQGNSGKFAYVVNHTGHSISTFRADPMSGELALMGLQHFVSYPRAITMHPSANPVFVAGGDDGRTVAMLRADKMSGMLSMSALFYAHDRVKALRTWRWTDPDTGMERTMLYVVTRAAVEFYEITGTMPEFRDWVKLPSNDEQAAALTASGYLYVANTDSIAAFAIDPGTGALQPVPGSPFLQDTKDSKYDWYKDDTVPDWPSKVEAPVISAAVGTSGKFLFVGNRSKMSLSAYLIDRNSGLLEHLAWSPKWLGARPTSIVAVGGRQQ